MSVSYAGKYELKVVNKLWYRLFLNGKEIGGYMIGKGGVYNAANYFKI